MTTRQMALKSNPPNKLDLYVEFIRSLSPKKFKFNIVQSLKPSSLKNIKTLTT